jgi:hypothetical protein
MFHTAGKRNRAGFIALVGVLAGLVLPAGAAAAGPRLALGVQGVTLYPVAGGKMPAAETEQPVTLKATVKGAIPGGARLRLATRATSVAPYRLQPGALAVHGSSAVAHVTAHVSSTVSYKLEVVSGSGAVLAHSAAVSIFWVAPPPVLEVSPGDANAVLKLKTGAVECAALTAAGPGACLDSYGTSSNGSMQLFANAGGTTPPGWQVSVTYKGATLCTSSTAVLSAECTAELTAPEVSAQTNESAQATLTSPSGQRWTLTFQFTVYP